MLEGEVLAAPFSARTGCHDAEQDKIGWKKRMHWASGAIKAVAVLFPRAARAG